jgi:flagellar biosynthetic protein FliQ
MTDYTVELLSEMLYITTLLAMPPLLVALAVGLVIGLLMAVTSIQEQTLTFVPKILAMVIVFIIGGAWMLQILVDYSYELFAGLPQYGAM